MLKGQLTNTIQPSMLSFVSQSCKTDFSKNQNNDFKAVFEKYSKEQKTTFKKNQTSNASLTRSEKSNDFRSEGSNTDRKTTQKSSVREFTKSKKDLATLMDECEEDKNGINNFNSNELLFLLAQLSEILEQTDSSDKTQTQEQFQQQLISSLQIAKDSNITDRILMKLEQLSGLLKESFYDKMLEAVYQDGSDVQGLVEQDAGNFANYFTANHNKFVSKEHLEDFDFQTKNQIIDLMNSLNAKIIAAYDTSSENLNLKDVDINNIIQLLNQKLAEQKTKISSNKQSNQNRVNAELFIDENIEAAKNMVHIEDNNPELTSNNDMLNANSASSGNTVAPNFASKVQGHSSTFANILQRINKDEIIGQVVKKISTANTLNKAEMVMELKPESLGKLTLKLVSENGLIAARFTAENEQVKQIIESNFQMLKDALEQKGYIIQGFSVSVGQDSSERSNQKEDRGNISMPASKAIIEEDISGLNYVGKDQVMQSSYIGFTSTKIDFTA